MRLDPVIEKVREKKRVSKFGKKGFANYPFLVSDQDMFLLDFLF